MRSVFALRTPKLNRLLDDSLQLLLSANADFRPRGLKQMCDCSVSTTVSGIGGDSIAPNNERVLIFIELRLTFIVSFADEENKIGFFGRELKAANAC